LVVHFPRLVGWWAGHSTDPVLLRFFSDDLQVGNDVVGLLNQLIKVANVRFIDVLEVAGDGASLLQLYAPE